MVEGLEGSQDLNDTSEPTKIQKAEERVIKTGKIYNAACDELKALRGKKAAIENEVLVEAFMKSDKTLEEVLAFLGAETMKSDVAEPQKKQRGRRKKVVE